MPKKTITPEIEQVMQDLRKQVKRAEEKGNFKTAHHQLLVNYEKEYGTVKETEHGKQDI